MHSTKTERLEARITKEQKKLFQRAAQLQGRTFTDFIVSSLQEASERVIKDHEIINLTIREREMFVEALISAQEPNEKFSQAAEFYKQTLKDQ